ncbi:MAG: cytochrome C [Candidatus Nealsonbacteria bacterium]|nr:cytochrome C [Candidatus Nealsonbacteria bacterium]
MTDPEFAAIVTRPDNVPIVAMVYLLGFFTWLSGSQAVTNDRRAEQGKPPVEMDHRQKVLTWPDLVYTELICMILVTVLLIVWSVALRAPLEQPADPVVTPNPSKAPWYFLGLQEMLVFSDAWNVGVVVPCLIVFGLAAIPYLDVNPAGSGHYSIRPRRFAYLVFQFGFLQLWVLLILIGTFMRGPTWTFFGPYEFHDPYKVPALTNVKLSEYFWVMLLGRGVPQAPADAGALVELGTILWREIVGVVLLAGYFLALPPLLGRTILRRFRLEMGFGRYTLMIVLLLLMMTLPLKMLLRWTFNLSYVVSIPEYLFNM